MKNRPAIIFSSLFLMIFMHAGAQVMDTINKEKTITINNFEVNDLDTYFTKSSQLIAFGS